MDLGCSVRKVGISVDRGAYEIPPGMVILPPEE